MRHVPTAPPFAIASVVHRFAPGIWPVFLRAANDAILPGSTVTSWHRTVAWNRTVGGARDSQHLIGTGFDVIPPIGQRAEYAERLRSRGFAAKVSLGHVHAQAFEAGEPRRLGILAAAGF